MTIVVATASVRPRHWPAYEELKPDVVITDLQLQDGTGLDIVRAIRKQTDASA